MRLFLVRHARPAVDPDVCYGSTDVPVPQEEQQATLEKLIPILPERVPIFSSPLQRCRTLASELACALDSGGVMLDGRLAEMHFGAWEMRTWDAIPRAEIDAWAANLQEYRPGGGESVLEVAQRVQAFHDDLRLRQCERAIVVCHAGTIRLLLAARYSALPMEMALHAARTAHRIGYGEVITLDCHLDN